MKNDMDNYKNWSPPNNRYNKMHNSDDTNKNKFPLYFNNYNKNKYSQNKPYKVNYKKYDNIELII